MTRRTSLVRAIDDVEVFDLLYAYCRAFLFRLFFFILCVRDAADGTVLFVCRSRQNANRSCAVCDPLLPERCRDFFFFMKSYRAGRHVARTATQSIQWSQYYNHWNRLVLVRNYGGCWNRKRVRNKRWPADYVCFWCLYVCTCREHK